MIPVATFQRWAEEERASCARLAHALRNLPALCKSATSRPFVLAVKYDPISDTYIPIAEPRAPEPAPAHAGGLEE